MLISQSLLDVYSRSDCCPRTVWSHRALEISWQCSTPSLFTTLAKHQWCGFQIFKRISPTGSTNHQGSTAFVTEQIHVIQRNKSDHPNQCIAMETMVFCWSCKQSRSWNTANSDHTMQCCTRKPFWVFVAKPKHQSCSALAFPYFEADAELGVIWVRQSTTVVQV